MPMLSALTHMSYVKLINIGDRQFFQRFRQTCFTGDPTTKLFYNFSPPSKKKELFLNRMKDMIIMSILYDNCLIYLFIYRLEDFYIQKSPKHGLYTAFIHKSGLI